MQIKRQTVNFNKNHFEKTAWENQSVIVGIDEVGRGCLAGPLVTAAVILPLNKTCRLLKDSKIMTNQELQKAASWIRKHCIFATGIVHNRIIDKHNIWHATLIAMKKAVIHILELYPTKPSAIVIDAMPLTLDDMPFCDIPIHYFTKGEQKSSSIAAASIIAKVTRDELMATFDTLIPGYKLSSNKGYATKAHKNSIFSHNASIIHRTTYLGKIIQHNDHNKQQKLF